MPSLLIQGLNPLFLCPWIALSLFPYQQLKYTCDLPRESFRQNSVIAEACVASIMGKHLKVIMMPSSLCERVET